jgi:hypothetical protein
MMRAYGYEPADVSVPESKYLDVTNLDVINSDEQKPPSLSDGSVPGKGLRGILKIQPTRIVGPKIVRHDRRVLSGKSF